MPGQQLNHNNKTFLKGRCMDGLFTTNEMQNYSRAII